MVLEWEWNIVLADEYLEVATNLWRGDEGLERNLLAA